MKDFNNNKSQCRNNTKPMWLRNRFHFIFKTLDSLNIIKKAEACFVRHPKVIEYINIYLYVIL